MGRRIKITAALLIAAGMLIGLAGCEDLGLLTTIRGMVDETDGDGDTTIPVTGVSLDKESITIPVGGTEQLTATVEPSDATDQSVSWSIDNESVATVDADGLVTGVAEGTAAVTVTTTDGGFTDTCAVTVGVVWTMSQSGTAGTAGSSITFTNNKENYAFTVNACPGGTFPTGIDDSGEAAVSAFWGGETEATNELVASVYQWAYDNNKMSGGTINSTTVTVNGQELLDLDEGYIQISFSGGIFSVDSGFEKYPCVEITWYGAVIFCNWLTEMVEGNEDEIVYEWVDNGDGEGTESDGIWQDDETDENNANTGFRLLSSNEWECAARYIGTTDPGYGIERPASSGIYWTPGDYASGATADYNNATATGDVAWYWENCGIDPQSHFYDDAGTWKGTHPVGTAGNGSGEGTPFTGNANQLGLYDMSGNVREWCFTEYDSFRVDRLGSWLRSADDLRVGDWGYSSPYGESSTLGFRVCRTAD